MVYVPIFGVGGRRFGFRLIRYLFVVAVQKRMLLAGQYNSFSGSVSRSILLVT